MLLWKCTICVCVSSLPGTTWGAIIGLVFNTLKGCLVLYGTSLNGTDTKHRERGLCIWKLVMSAMEFMSK